MIDKVADQTFLKGTDYVEVWAFNVHPRSSEFAIRAHMENLRARFLLERLQKHFPHESRGQLLIAIRVINSTARGDETWDEYADLVKKHLAANPQLV